MAIKIVGTTSAVEVDTDATPKAMKTSLYNAAGTALGIDTDGNAKVQIRGPAFGALGSYSMGTSTGAIVATGSAAAVIWTLRWTDSTRLALIERIRVAANVRSTITTAVPYDLELYLSRSYTVSPTTSITASTITGNNAKRRTSMGTTLVSGIWTLTTVAAGITGQTFTNDAQAIGRISGNSGTVVGTQFFGPNPASLWDNDINGGGHPLVLAQNEGVTIQAPLAGPATGTFAVIICVDWVEVASY